jgi:hypothetical protein
MVRSIGHDSKQTMEIELNGGIYQAHPVTIDQYRELLATGDAGGSVGKAWHALINAKHLTGELAGQKIVTVTKVQVKEVK